MLVVTTANSKYVTYYLHAHASCYIIYNFYVYYSWTYYLHAHASCYSYI